MEHGPLAGWRHDQIYNEDPSEVQEFCRTCLADEATEREDHPYHAITAYLKHFNWVGEWERVPARDPDGFMAARCDLTTSAPAGLAVWDTACGLTAHSPAWRIRFVKELAKYGLSAHRRSLEEHERVRGVGGNMELSSCWFSLLGCTV